MDLWTVGKAFYPGLRLKLSYIPDESITLNGEEQSGCRFVLIEEGIGIIKLGKEAYPIVAPAIYCLNENETMDLVVGNHIKARSLRFHPSVINARITSISDSTEEGAFSNTDFQDTWYFDPFVERNERYYGCIPIDPAMAKHTFQLVDQIGHQLTLQADKHWPCRSRSFLLELLILLRRIYQSDDTIPNHIPNWSEMNTIKPVIEYLHTHYREKIKIEELTTRFFINKTTLNQRFRSAVGTSIISYLNTIRMQMASSMLRNTLLPISEIMGMTGFVDDAHFIRNFRKYVGCSPSEYRNKNCWMLK